MKLAVVTNILTPYRIPLFESLGKSTKACTVLLQARQEENRQWRLRPFSFHAEILPVGSGWLLRDLGSSNGTWTDAGGVRELDLASGTTFRIGRTYLRFEDGEAADLGATILGDEGGWRDPDHVEGLGAETTLLRRGEVRPDDAELRRSNDYLILLHQIVLRSNQAEGREQLFELLDDVAADALESDRCAVFLPTPDGWALWPPHERRLRARFGATPFARSLLAQVRARLEPLLCTQEGDLTPTTSMVQAGMPSAMAAPLRLRDEVHALLYVDRLSGHEVFTRTDLEFLAAVANQLAVRLHNCDAVAQLAAEVDRLSAQTPPSPVLDLVGKDPALEARKKQAEEAEAARKKAEEEKYARDKAQNCERARRAMTTLKSGVRIQQTNAKGEREYLDDAGRNAEVQRTQGAIDSNCK